MPVFSAFIIVFYSHFFAFRLHNRVMAQLKRNYVLYSYLFNELQVLCISLGPEDVLQTLELSGKCEGN